MNPDDLRESLISEMRASDDSAPEDIESTDDLARHIQLQAQRIRGRFTAATDTGERNQLRDRYKLLDRWMKELSRADALDSDERDAARQRLRAKMLDEFRNWNLGQTQVRARADAIELGRKQLTERARAGAASHAHKRIKDEIDYLLKNYTPANEYKIETLIDKWRTSGDPGYDPSVKIRLRQARRKKNDSDYAI